MIPTAPRRDGFTIVEVLLVCSMIGLLLLLAVPTFATTADSLRLRNATSLLASDLRAAQALAQQSHLRTRVQLVPTADGLAYSGYQIQTGTTETAGLTCDPNSTDYTTVKREMLESELRVRITKAVLECLILEPTGRVAWVSPRVLDDASPSDLADGIDATWTRYFDGIQKTGNATVLSDPRANKWSNRSSIRLSVDLGQPRLVDWICSEVLDKKTFDGIYFPQSIQLYGSTLKTDTPPDSTQWNYDFGLVTYPDPNATQVPGSPAMRSCQRFKVIEKVPQRIRYLRFVITPTAVSGAYKTVAMDEIMLSSPTITLQGLRGQGSRTITIAPVTGQVTIN